MSLYRKVVLEIQQLFVRIIRRTSVPATLKNLNYCFMVDRNADCKIFFAVSPHNYLVTGWFLLFLVFIGSTSYHSRPLLVHNNCILHDLHRKVFLVTMETLGRPWKFIAKYALHPWICFEFWAQKSIEHYVSYLRDVLLLQFHFDVINLQLFVRKTEAMKFKNNCPFHTGCTSLAIQDTLTVYLFNYKCLISFLLKQSIYEDEKLQTV